MLCRIAASTAAASSEQANGFSRTANAPNLFGPVGGGFIQNSRHDQDRQVGVLLFEYFQEFQPFHAAPIDVAGHQAGSLCRRASTKASSDVAASIAQYARHIQNQPD